MTPAKLTFMIVMALASPLIAILAAVALLVFAPFAPIVFVVTTLRREHRIKHGCPRNAQEFAEWAQHLAQIETAKAAAAAVVQRKSATQNTNAN